MLPFFILWLWVSHSRYSCQTGDSFPANTLHFQERLTGVENAVINLLKILVFLTLTNQPLYVGKSRDTGPVAT